MRQSLTVYDVPLILGMKFEFSTLTDDIMWLRDKAGRDWQVWIRGQFLNFTTREQDKLTYEPYRRMTHEEFRERFA